jgi:hypothetical protein
METGYALRAGYIYAHQFEAVALSFAFQGLP